MVRCSSPFQPRMDGREQTEAIYLPTYLQRAYIYWVCPSSGGTGSHSLAQAGPVLTRTWASVSDIPLFLLLVRMQSSEYIVIVVVIRYTPIPTADCSGSGDGSGIVASGSGRSSGIDGVQFVATEALRDTAAVETRKKAAEPSPLSLVLRVLNRESSSLLPSQRRCRRRGCGRRDFLREAFVVGARGYRDGGDFKGFGLTFSTSESSRIT